MSDPRPLPGSLSWITPNGLGISARSPQPVIALSVTIRFAATR